MSSGSDGMEGLPSRQLREARRLSPDGKLIYEANVNDYMTNLRIEYKYIELIFIDVGQFPVMDPTAMITYKNELFGHMNAYTHFASIFDNYLKAVRSEESHLERASQELITKSLQEKVAIATENMDNMLRQLENTGTKCRTS